MEKIAVVLIETFSAKLVIASVVNNSYFVVSDTECETVKLDIAPDADMFLKKNQIELAVKVLKNFRKICEMHQVSKVIAVSTFVGAKKPKNIYSFFEEIFNTCGFRFSILSDEEQNSAIYSGIINTFDLPKGVICHITPESIHLICYNRRMILNQATLPFGSYSLADMFPLDGDNKNGNLENMADYVMTKLETVDFLKNIEDEFSLVGNGFYYEDFAKMVKRLKKYPLDLVNNFVMPLSDMEKVYGQIKTVELDKNKKIKGVSESRADAFVAAMIINNCVAKFLKKEEVVVSTRGVVEGLLFNQTITLTQEKPLSDVLGFSMLGQSLYYDDENSKHNEQVYNLAMLLFKQLRVLHKLPRNYTKILRLASYLHDCGTRIGFANHAKNGFSVILGTDIYGATHRELLLAGFAISLHCGGDIPMSEFIKYRELISEDDIVAVKQLGVIIRLAEAFDRTKNNVIVDINCDILGDSVIMKTIAVGDNSFEIEKASECAKDFEKNFGKKIEIL